MASFYCTYAVRYFTIHGGQMSILTILGSPDRSTISESALTALGLTVLMESPSSHDILLNPDIIGTVELTLKIDSHWLNVEFDVVEGIPGFSIATLGPEMAAGSELRLNPLALTFNFRGGADLPMLWGIPPP